jgi:hypothetical protein
MSRSLDRVDRGETCEGERERVAPIEAVLTSVHVTGPDRFDRVGHASHWLPEVHPGLVAAKVLDHLRGVDAPAAG